MKKLLPIIGMVLLIAAGIATALIIGFSTNTPKEEEYVDKTTASYNGKLHVSGNKILNSHNEEVQLRGISTHGIQWYDELYSSDNIAQLKKEFNINVFRIAMYTDPNAGGYIANPALKEKVYELVDACIALDIYVIVDWHILNDNNPQTYETQAKEFFTEVSAKYRDVPNVIYEICNEPNGKEITWEYNIYPYAVDVLSAIRANASDAFVIVGTPDWSKDLKSVQLKPLDDKNVAYALHFYAGSHNKTLRDTIDDFRDHNLAVFISECGATDATGAGELYEDAFKRWADYMKDRKLSWVYWSYSNKDEASAMLEKDYVPDYSAEPELDENGNPIEFSLDSHLTASGKIAKKFLSN